MATISAAQEQEVTYLSGVTAQKTIAYQSFWTWNGNSPATYSSVSSEAKWGAASAGAGASVSVSFDAASNWSGTEKAAIESALHLWSDIANIHFDLVGSSAANIVVARSGDGMAEEASRYSLNGGEGSTSLGTLTSSRITIDTSVDGFGPIGAGFQVEGGYPWQTLVHEIGHAIGLGHAGAYNEGTTTTSPMLTAYDSTAWSVMSYNPSSRSDAATGGSHNWGNAADGSPLVPVTPMALDILAAQRLYGLPTSTSLSGGQVFGFHSNIQGVTAAVYDFAVNTRPVVSLWDVGTANTLDLSGYATPNTVDLHAGNFSSVGGATGNLAIAYDTAIDTFVGGTGNDQVIGNDDGDALMGNAGNDALRGGAGNDHIWGNMAFAMQGSQDGDDTIYTGLGTNYVNGNAGNDLIFADGDVGRIYGGAGNDAITIRTTVGSHVNGNAGNDSITLTSGSNVANGGRDDDRIFATSGNNVMSGDAGNDTLTSGSGVDVMTGGTGHDTFRFSPAHDYDPYAGAALIPSPRTYGVAPADRNGTLAGYHDEITDLTHGEDVIAIGNDAGGARAVLHGDAGVFAAYDAAASYARSLIAAAGMPSAIAAVQVGDDTFLFYNEAGNGSGIDSAIKLDHVSAASMQSSDFVLY